MIWIRESFGAKLLSALFGTVLLLTTITFAIVQVQMGNEVDAEVERTMTASGELFEELNDLQRQQAARLTETFTVGPRAVARLDGAIRAGDVEYFAGEVAFDRELAGLDDMVIVFTDPDGVPFVSILGDSSVVGADPVGVGPLIEPLLREDAQEASGYRLVNGLLYPVTAIRLALGFRSVGTITYGLPIEPADVQRIGNLGEFEACLYADGACALRTEGVGPDLAEALVAAAGSSEPTRTTLDGEEYLLRSDPLVPDDPDQGMRIIAIPLDEVIGPFRAIQRALLFGGGFALLLSGLFGATLGRTLTRPIRDLVVAVGRVAEGDFEAEVEVDSEDEMGTLATAFNEMTHGLLVRERYRSVLNMVVSQDVAEELMKGDVELGGENREVSVLFADIRGFTPMTEGMEPQEVIALLNDCMEHLAQAVDAEGGVVDKFIGDELMAVFGAPAHQTDHALRAVRAAIGMRLGIAEMNLDRGARGLHPLHVGIGINSGIAVAGNMGSTDRLNYTVLGKTVNLAARLVDEAESGQILVSEETLHKAGDGLVTHCVGPIGFKGFSADVAVFAVESCA